jgi:hypothetical protein
MTIAIILAIAVISNFVAASIAKSKGRSEFGWSCIGFLFGPLGVLFAYVMPTKQEA